MIKKLLYTLVFSINCILLFVLVYWLSDFFFPGQLQVQDNLSNVILIRWSIVFIVIVFLSFQSASQVVYGESREPYLRGQGTGRANRERAHPTRGSFFRRDSADPSKSRSRPAKAGRRSARKTARRRPAPGPSAPPLRKKRPAARGSASIPVKKPGSPLIRP